jgi:hypothetical protein
MERTDPTIASQSDRFKRAARELGCDESEKRFVETVTKIAKGRPQHKTGGKAARKEASAVRDLRLLRSFRRALLLREMLAHHVFHAARVALAGPHHRHLLTTPAHALPLLRL